MGDTFRQRRSAKQKGIDQPQAQRIVSHTSTTARPPSILEIQAEEERLLLQARGRLEQDRAPYHSSSGGTAGRDDFPRRVERRGREDAFSSRRRGENDRSHLPLEQGCVCSLKDAFGFIYCADRQEELFFHFSEVQNCHAADLALDDELEFRVGNDRNSDKLRAFQVNRLERGSIVWEVEDNPGVRYQGVVEKPVRNDRHGTVQQEGIIRMLEKPHEGEQVGEEEISATAGAAILFSHNDYQPNGDVNVQDMSYSGRSPRDSRGGNSSSASRTDFGAGGGGGGGAIRLGVNDLVEFDVVTSRRTKNKHARSIVLLQSDRERQTFLKEATLLASASVEQGIVTSLKSDFGFLRSNKRREEIYFHYSNIVLSDDDKEEQELKVGNEMQFLVVVEEATGNSRKEKISARQVKFLPAGTVKFEITLAQGVTGVVTRCPHPADSNHSSEALGIVRLTESISDVDFEGYEVLVREVGFYSADSPGGTYSLREGMIGLWIREGDTILFDVVKQTMDGFLRVFPTLKQVGDHASEDNEAPSVKLVACALALRQEGTVHVIKEEFGFINLAERAAETYFRLYEQFPKEIQRDLLRGMGVADQPVLKMVVDSEVQFDLSLQREVIRSKGRNQRGGGQQESLKAQRVLLLPPGTITPLNKVLVSGIAGIVEKEDPKQPYSGMIELASEVNCMTLEERHPLAAKLARSLLERNEALPKALIFPDIQSVKEDDVVTNVLETVGMGRLRCSSLPTAGQGKNGGRMCISWSQDDESFEESEAVVPQEGINSMNDPDPDVDARIKNPGSPTKQKKGSKKGQPAKVVKHIRYDKACLATEFQGEQPPRAGDKVSCDVIQSRRTGFLLLQNMRIKERKDPDGPDKSQSESKEAGVGFVSDVVVARKFGFITLFDEDSTRKEVLFFHLESVLHQNSMGLVKKGDEVKFMIATKQGGKRTAVGIEILPRGTLSIPAKAAKNACEGFVLLEPSTSSLKNTPNQKSLSPVRGGSSHKLGGGGTGRWGNVDLDNERVPKGTTKGEGLIMLTKDPSNMFGSNRKQDPGSTSIESTNPDNGNDKSQEAIGSEASHHCTLCTHLPYKLGAVAIHGVGSASGVDSLTKAPRRGDLVSFIRSKDGKGVRDVRVVTKGAATLIQGHLEQIVVDLDSAYLGTALFIANNETEEIFPIKLEEMISCEVSVLNDKEPVEGIIHDGSVVGVCRIKDLFLESKLGSRHKMRTKLNLTVKQGLGGKIMAQSMMGKGPDDTTGFVEGWTTRVSKYAHL